MKREYGTAGKDQYTVEVRVLHSSSARSGLGWTDGSWRSPDPKGPKCIFFLWMKSVLWDRSLLGGGAASRRAVGVVMSDHVLRFIAPSRNLEIRGSSSQRGPVTCLDFEQTEGRLLLTGGLDCSVSMWDLEKRESVQDMASAETTAALAAGRSPPSRSALALAQRRRRRWSDGEGWCAAEPRQVRPLGHAGRGARAGAAPGSGGEMRGHTFAVSAVQWYPVDAGAFVSGAHDGKLKVRRLLRARLQSPLLSFPIAGPISCGWLPVAWQLRNMVVYGSRF